MHEIKMIMIYEIKSWNNSNINDSETRLKNKIVQFHTKIVVYNCILTKNEAP